MTKPRDFLAGSNIYEVNLRQYTPSGSFSDFATHLPRLKAMGIDILWFMPLTPISIKERKGTLGSYYAASDYITINPEYGTEEEFKQLVSVAHDQGFKVIMDWVANHTGWDHTWTKTHPNYYIRDRNNAFTERNGWEDVIDLDYANQDMRQAMIDSMAYWVQTFDIDGFRCDMAMLVHLEFWAEARLQIDKIKCLIWLAECEDVNYFQVFDILYAWEWMHLTKNVAHGHSDRYALEILIREYDKRKLFPKRYLYFTSNHDENSWNGTEYERYGSLNQVFAALTMVLPDGIPLIYSGQELPLIHRLKFFDKDLIPWSEEGPRLHSFYHVLLKLRKTNQWYQNADNFIYDINQLTEDSRIFSLQVGLPAEDDIIGLFNLTNEKVHFSLQNIIDPGNYKNVLTSDAVFIVSGLNASLEAGDFRIYLRNPYSNNF
ncbi:MAG: alpha-amylase family glycosyl hydrolase [Saprospiraceae bacterium]